MELEKLSFSNGKIDSVGFENPYFVVYFRLRNAERYKLKFEDFQYIEMFELDTDTNDTVVISESDEIEEVKNRILTNGGSPKSYNYFNFHQINFASSSGIVFLKVVYQGYTIEAI